ncbi:hypothetical protein Y032_0222g2616 [Ancylostoma ceylanicum]|uniref:SCP domain-containing protein n=2 Tax=Ancylostoma ceylanicum TaxID=53326 RepID=A0A016SHP4_9BILA|nr:hypothetical protein Y032_0222g2616 [Ancylostoma ceylanicum]
MGCEQRVARGEAERFGPAREMYGLVYDCGLEKKAARETRRPGNVGDLGAVRFTIDYEGSEMSALNKVLKTLYSDEGAMRQVIYPKATRYGCSARLRRNKKTGVRRMEWVCLYDKKPQDGESLEGGKFCNENKDCTYYKDSTCEWDLCYTFF